MKLLVLTNNPQRASFRQRIAVYLDILRAVGVNCEVFQLPSGVVARKKLFSRARDFDAVLLHKKCLNLHDGLWLRRCSRKIIYDFDDAIMYSPKRPESNRTSHYRLFVRQVKLVDMAIAGNEYLASHARGLCDRVEVLPTGLDTNEYKICKPQKEDGRLRLVWIGSSSTLAYLEGIKPALEQLGARFPDLVLRIICDEFFDIKNVRVEKRKWTLLTQFSELVTSDIGLAPLVDNRFTRGKCGFKVLQYQSSGLPVVSSPVGVNAQYVEDGLTGFHAASNEQWVEMVSELIENPRRRKQMAQAGRKHVEKYNLEVTGLKFIELVTGCDCHSAGVSLNKTQPVYQMQSPSSSSPKTVSVCIPTYNRRRYLQETIDSVVAQTYKDYEIVIVDDGSTDGTAEMIKKLGLPVVYHYQQNQGDAAARNKLVQLARGKYITFIDSDDLMMPDALSRMTRTMEAEDEDVIVYGSYLRMDENGRVYSKCKRKLYSGYITEHLFQTVLVHSCGSLFPQRILNGEGLFNTLLKICSDYDLWLRLSKKYKFVALPRPTFKRRRHPGNLATGSFQNCLAELAVLERFYYENGGREYIPRRIAMKVFSKERCRAGRHAVEEGLYRQAYSLLTQSFKEHPNFKSLVHLTRAVIAGRFNS